MGFIHTSSPGATPRAFLHGLSSSCHLVLVLTISVMWARNRNRPRHPPTKPSESSRSILFAVSFLGILFLLFSSSVCFCIMRGLWPPDVLAISALSDLFSRAFCWLLTSVYLYLRFFPSAEKVFPVFLKVWWCLFLLIASSFVILDFFTVYRQHGIVQIHTWVLDFGSFLFGNFLVCLGFAWRTSTEEDSDVLEPLLNGAGKTGHTSNCNFPSAGILSLLTFFWMGSLFSLGYRKTLDLKDVPDLAESDSTHTVYPKFKYKLHSCLPGRYDVDSNSDHQGGNVKHSINTISLVKALVFTTWKHILFTAFCALIHTLTSYIGPYLIDKFVQYLNGTRHFASEGYVLVLAFVGSKLLENLSQRHWVFRLQQVGIRVRAALVAMIYEKGMMLSSNSRKGHNTGEIVNLMSIDAERIGGFSWYMHDLWMIPVQVMLVLLILYFNLGLASIAALVATAVVMMANYPIGRLQEKYAENMMDAKDARMRATSEILRNMRILKLQAWELKFLSKIMKLREKETNWLKKYVYTFAMTIVAYWGAPTVVSVVTFGACILMGIPLQSGKVLSALATFKVFQEPIYNLPDTVSMVIQTKVSLDRIAAFLCLEDLQSDAVERLPRGTSALAIEVRDASFSWDPSLNDATLKTMNIQVLHGQSVAVCGMVGAGKSSLLSCLLGEIPKLSGTVKLWGKIAYVPQSPWILSGTLENNILFGKKMDREKYEKVLEACSLKKDMEVLPFGDQTVIGERGINLSGGQKQRIQIARALYDDADIYLLDDPFSAIDAHTKAHIFKECFIGLLGSKTVVYVTHQIEFLPSAELILVMKQGRIAQMGKYFDIISSGTDLLELLDAHQKALSSFKNFQYNTGDSSNTPVDGCSGITSDFCVSQEKIIGDKSNHCEPVETWRQLTQEEEREKGRVGLSIYWKYITITYKGALVLPKLLAQILFQVFQIGSNYWMAWATPTSEESMSPVSSLTLISIYIAMSIGSSACVIVRTLLVATVGYKTAITLFNKMHSCIFRAPMYFFDSTPSGRILNRASTDQNELDTNIAYQMGSVAVAVIELLGIIAVMSQVAWQIFVIFIPVAAACIWYQNYYMATARELSRLIGVCKAPIIQHFAESLSGSSTIRSFNQEERFINTNFHLSDAYSRPKFYNAAAMEWLCLRLNMLTTMVFAFLLVFLISLPNGTLNPGIAGLAVTYGLNLNMIQFEVIWNLCKLENNIISVERILQYACVPSEAPLYIETGKPDSNWPSKGQVEICDLQVRYAPYMPFVLKGLNCIFPGGRKIGIVGRTGSGKSTLIQTLFRIVEPTIGKILIDGIDIASIGLHDLRSRLSIIPQDPTMFEGTLRTNLDPLCEHSDEQIWEALDKCQLKEQVQHKEHKLESAVTENGENWSMGQRQLVCLGRVLLKRSKILILDEATASVDTASDNLMQKTLREQFSETTVITIAHRITSVLDSDMVCLIDNGMIVEFDPPFELLANKSSLFAKLVSEYTQSSSGRQ